MDLEEELRDKLQITARQEVILFNDNDNNNNNNNNNNGI